MNNIIKQRIALPVDQITAIITLGLLTNRTPIYYFIQINLVRIYLKFFCETQIVNLLNISSLLFYPSNSLQFH